MIYSTTIVQDIILMLIYLERRNNIDTLNEERDESFFRIQSNEMNDRFLIERNENSFEQKYQSIHSSFEKLFEKTKLIFVEMISFEENLPAIFAPVGTSRKCRRICPALNIWFLNSIEWLLGLTLKEKIEMRLTLKNNLPHWFDDGDGKSS